MSKLVFLGSGSAFTLGADNFHSNILLINELGHKLLIDCGSDIRFSLDKAGFSYLDITDIYISHLHYDHAGGLEYMGLITKFNPHCRKPKLYLSPDIAITIWQKTLAGGMEFIEGEEANLNTFFELKVLNSDKYFIWDNIQFNLIKVDHVNTGKSMMPVYGLFFELDGQKIFFTGDTKFCPDGMITYYEQANIIFHDCETSDFPTPVHAHYEELLTLPERIKNKMWLYGYNPGKLPNAQKDGFLGFVKVGQEFEFSLAQSEGKLQLII